MVKNRHIVLTQIVIILIIFGSIYFLYPKTNIIINQDRVKFNSINARVIEISDNPDFSNSRYVELSQFNNLSFSFKPGKYYWRAYNSYIEGFKEEFNINSEVSMKINRSEKIAEITNVGNVKINVTKNENGVMVGHVILGPEFSSNITDKGEQYVGKEVE